MKMAVASFLVVHSKLKEKVNKQLLLQQSWITAMKPSFGHLAGTDLWEKQWEDNEEIA